MHKLKMVNCETCGCFRNKKREVPAELIQFGGNEVKSINLPIVLE